jgi:hypothetical protein
MTPYELGLALACIEQADADAYSYAQRAEGKGADKKVVPVYVVGRL